MYKIAVIGTADTVKSYRALGLDVFPVDSDEKAKSAFDSLAKPDSDYRIIYIEESFADCMHSELRKYMTSSQLTVCMIPGRGGAQGHGPSAIQSSIERAIGADIL